MCYCLCKGAISHCPYIEAINVLPLFRGYLVDTGQEFVNTRGADSNAQPLEFDSGMGILPEAIDMTGENGDKRLCEHAYNMNTQKLSRMLNRLLLCILAQSLVSSPAAAKATDAGVSLSWSRRCEPAIMLA